MTDSFRIARGLRGYAHRARLRTPSSKETRPSLTWPWLPPRIQGLARAPGSRSMARPSLTLGSCPTNDASQGPGARRQALSHKCSGAPRRCSLSTALPTAPLTGSRPGHDTRRQSFPLASRDSGASGPARQPLEPTSFATKKSPEGPPMGASPSWHSLTRRVPWHRHSPRRTAARPSSTPTHVDHRLLPPNHHVPNLSHYIRDKVRPRRGEDPRSITRHSIPFHPPPLRNGSKATKRGAPRAPPPYPFIFLLSDKGEGSTGGEATLELALS
jgi:hypothetical protein